MITVQCVGWVAEGVHTETMASGRVKAVFKIISSEVSTKYTEEITLRCEYFSNQDDANLAILQKGAHIALTGKLSKFKKKTYIRVFNGSLVLLDQTLTDVEDDIPESELEEMTEMTPEEPKVVELW